MNTKIERLLAWMRQGRKRKAEKKKKVIGLPKDGNGREIPLDTKVLYDENGDAWDVDQFEYSAGGFWRVFRSHGVFHYRTDMMYLTRPGSMENAATDTAEKKPMTIKLPKDIEGREIPLDTRVLYGVTGHTHYVEQFEYSPGEGGVWRVQFEDGIFHFRTNRDIPHTTGQFVETRINRYGVQAITTRRRARRKNTRRGTRRMGR